MKSINYKTIKLDDVNPKDYPDFVDAFICYAEFEDGTPLTDDELEALQETVDMNELAHESFH